MEMDKKTNKGIMVVIVLLVILLVGSIGYIIYDKMMIKEDTNESMKEEKTKKKEEEIENLDIHSDLIQNLFNIFRMDKSCYMSVDALNNSNRVKLRVAYDQLGKSNFSFVSCSEIGANDAVKGAYCGEMNNEMMQAYETGNMTKFNEETKNNYTTSLDATVLKRKVHELFGSDYQYQDEDFGIGHVVEPTCYLMHYNQEKKLYGEYMCEGGGSCGRTEQTITKATKTGQRLEIITNVVDVENKSTTVTYQFKYEQESYHYVFDKAIES